MTASTLDDLTRRGPGEPPKVQLRVLGPLCFEVDGHGLHVAGSHRRRLLALLASRAGRAVSVDMIVAGLWDDEEIPPSATKTIQAHVMRLRRSLQSAGEVISTVPHGYRLDVSPDVIDAVRFEALAADGRREIAQGDHRAALEHLDAALELWRGPAYVEFSDASFAAAERVRLDEVRLSALEDRAEANLAIGNAAVAVAELEHLVADEPGREHAWGALMRALYAAGRQHDALQVYDRARRALAEHFGLEPGPDLRRLERRVLDQDPTLYVAGERSLMPAALRASTPMIGRTEELEFLRRAWRCARRGTGQVVVLTGPTDSGRTRLAGAIAAEVVADNGFVEYARAAEGLDALVVQGAASGVAVDAITERCRRGPVLLVLDDAERLPAAVMPAIEAIALASERLSLLVLFVVDPTASGPSIDLVGRIPTAVQCDLASMSDDELRRIMVADGVEPDAMSITLAVAAGLPGVARREAAAWAERTAGDRLQAAATSSLGASHDAERARATVHDEVLALVGARARRDELLSDAWVGRQPFRALESYGPEDADLFVGRERLTADLAARVLDRRLVAVVGPSGGGKSSLARAGLVPLVRSGRLPGGGPWRCSVIVPGTTPLAALDQVDELDEPGAQLLVVDQFEEAFASDQAGAFASRLVDLVLDAALDVHVVIVVRADHYAALSTMRPLCDLIEDATVLVGPPNDDELRRIVEVPARRTGCVVEPALADAVVRDVGVHDSALPLVSAALADAWVHRRADMLTLEHYMRSGGLASAVERLGRHALDHADASAIRRLMLRLVDVTDDGHWVRRRVPVSEVPAELHPALDALVGARLVQRGDEIEVVHEVVFTAWPQLAEWLEDARADLVTERWLRAAASAWDDGGRSDDDALRGARLAAAVDYLERRPESPPVMHDLVDAGRRIAALEHERAEAQRSRDRRARRRLTGALIGAALLLVVALIGSLVAVGNGRRADDERRNALDAAAAAGIARLVAESERELDSHLDLALLLAVEAYDHAPTPETAGALLTALTDNMTAERNLPGAALRHPGQLAHTNSSFVGFIAGAPAIGFDVDVSDDGRIVVSGGRTGTGTTGLAVVFDTVTRREIARVQTEYFVDNVDVSPDGAHVLARDATGAIHVVDTAARSSTPLDLGNIFAEAARFVDDDRIVVTTDDGELFLVDRSTGAPIEAAMPIGQSWVDDVGNDGTLLISQGTNTLVFWDVEAGREVRKVVLDSTGAGVGIARYAASADGSRVAGIEDEGRLYLWNADTGELIGDAATRPGTARGLAFSAVDPAILAVGSTGGGIAFYDVEHDRLIGEPLLGHGSGPRDIAFSSDGAYMVSIADDGLIGLWGPNDAGGPLGTPDPDGEVFAEVDEHEWTPPDAGFDNVVSSMSPDGRRVVGIDYTFTHLRVWDVESGARLGDARPSRRVSSGRPRFSPDGRYVDIVADFDVIRYDGTDLHEVSSVRAPFAIQGELVHVPGTDHVIGAGLGGYVGRFDLGDGTVLAMGRSRDSSNLESASISPDGTMIATYHPYSFRVALFDAATLRPIGRPFPAGDLVFVPRFTSDGHLAGNGLFNVPTQWDVDPASWRAAACRAAGRNLTHDEWTEYLGGEPYHATCSEWGAAS